MTASVLLIQALGGGWDTTQLPRIIPTAKIPRWNAIVTGVRPVGCAQLAQDMLDVHLDRSAGCAQSAGDLFVR